MKKFIIILLMIMPFFGFGQTENENYILMSGEFEKYFNGDEYEKLFNLFSKEMKDFLPLEKTKILMSRLKSQAGAIRSREFIRFQSATYAIYKTTFDKGVFALNMSLNADSQIDGLFLKPYFDENIQKLERNMTKLILPFKEEWTVFWGGDTKDLNYHVDHPAQKNAFDIVIMDEKGKSFKTDGKTNEDYYAFGKDLIAPCDAEVVLAVDGIKDNKPGEMNAVYVPGNTVILKTSNNEYLFFAHFKQNSIVVKEGQLVKQGQLLGLCGNSGNSSEPHLHFHIQNDEDMNKATGAKCFFENIVVNKEVKNDYSPIKGDKIRSK